MGRRKVCTTQRMVVALSCPPGKNRRKKNPRRAIDEIVILKQTEGGKCHSRFCKSLWFNGQTRCSISPLYLEHYCLKKNQLKLTKPITRNYFKIPPPPASCSVSFPRRIQGLQDPWQHSTFLVTLSNWR